MTRWRRPHGLLQPHDPLASTSLRPASRPRPRPGLDWNLGQLSLLGSKLRRWLKCQRFYRSRKLFQGHRFPSSSKLLQCQEWCSKTWWSKCQSVPNRRGCAQQVWNTWLSGLLMLPWPRIVKGAHIFKEFCEAVHLQNATAVGLLDKHGVIDEVDCHDTACDVSVDLDHVSNAAVLMCSYVQKAGQSAFDRSQNWSPPRIWLRRPHFYEH